MNQPARQVEPSIHGPVYHSNFPGTEQVDARAVFSRPGYNEQRQATPTLAVLGVVSLILSWGFPPFSWFLAVVPLILGLILIRRYRTDWCHRPGKQVFRGIIVLSTFTVVLAVMAGFLFLIVSGEVTLS